MTQEEIDKLPKPPFVPARDMMLCQREESTPSGIYLPDEAAEKVQVCRVLCVGRGLVLDTISMDSFQVKPCPYERGTRLFTSPNDGYPIKIDGTTYWLFEVSEVMGELTDDKVFASGGREHC